jgi:hypothetical protein
MNKPLAGTVACILAACAVAPSADRPELREGLWQITNNAKGPSLAPKWGAVQFCRTHASDKEQQAYLDAKTSQYCQKRVERNADGSISTKGTCELDNTDSTSETVDTFIGDTAWHSEVHSTYTPPFYGVSEDRYSQDEKWLGPCPPDMKPGDMKFTDGTIRHLQTQSGQPGG